jgi:hypothetical protein
MSVLRRGTFVVVAALGCAGRVAFPVKSPGAAPTSTLVDDRYYDFWPGTWYAVNDGVRDSVPTFVVRRGVHPAVFEEEWRLVIDSGRVSRSTGLRAWDQTYAKWMFVWVSDLGHFQIWEGVRIGNRWYIQRAFEQGGQRFLSRQAWIPEGPDRVVRIMERSFDEGRTWQPRSRVAYQRDAP